MKKLSLASGLMFMSAVASANFAPDQACELKGGIFVSGTCIETSAAAQVALALGNDHRKSGGNETSVGDNVIQVDAKVSKDYDNQHFKTIFINISAVPKDQVLNYQEKNEQNYHNGDRFRADGYVDRPWLLASIGAGLELSESQDLTLLAGSFEASGLSPLAGKPSRYYMTAPYGLIVRYDKGIQMNYELKDELDRIIAASFSVIDGDTVKGQSSVEPSDSRANSYPAYAGTVELHVANALKRVFDNLSPYLKNHDLYMGVTGNRGDTGSYVGEKRMQDDFITYVGYVMKTSKGEGEIRVFKSNFTRNPYKDGNGRHTNLVNSEAYGAEVAFRGFETKGCDWELYGNKHYFEADANGPDGEFTWNKQRKVEGWTVGLSCKNFRKIESLDIGFEYGEVNTYDANDKKLAESGMQFGLVFNYKMGLSKIKKRK